MLLLLLACHRAPPVADVPPTPAAPAPAEAVPAPTEVPPTEPIAPIPCRSSADCASGVCEGVGCDDDHPGLCVQLARACTRDLRPYCGCDGQTFFSGGNCPMRRYQHPGPCAEAAEP